MRSARQAEVINPKLAPVHSVLAKLYLQSESYQEAVLECRKSLELDPKDQTSIYRLIQALRKSEHKDEIPALLKRLAELREEETREERERYRYRLIEETASAR
jgi:two-component SAPR family response regulator